MVNASFTISRVSSYLSRATQRVLFCVHFEAKGVEYLRSFRDDDLFLKKLLAALGVALPVVGGEPAHERLRLLGKCLTGRSVRADVCVVGEKSFVTNFRPLSGVAEWANLEAQAVAECLGRGMTRLERVQAGLIPDPYETTWAGGSTIKDPYVHVPEVEVGYDDPTGDDICRDAYVPTKAIK